MTTATTGGRGVAISPDPLLQTESGITESCWIAHDFPAGEKVHDRPPLSADLECEACVIGAGIAGLTAAYRLARAGRRVVVIDDGPVCGSESGRTTSILNTYPDDGLSTVEKRHDLETVQLALHSYADAIRFMEQVCRDEQIDEGFAWRDEYLFVHRNGRGQDYLDKEIDVARRAKWPDFTFVDRAPTPGIDTGRAILLKNQAQLHAGRYLARLADAVERHGGRMFNRTHVTELAGGKDAFAKTDNGRTVRCQWLVTCTNSPIINHFAKKLQIDMRQMPYRTYVVGLDVGDADVPEVIYSDTLWPYHYVRPQMLYGAGGRTERILIVGGEDVKTAHSGHDDPARFDRLEEFARTYWPGLGARRYAWSGQVFEPEDCLAFIGRVPGGEENELVYTGDSGQGTTHGTVGALILSDRILGNPPRRYAKIYSTTRASLSLGTVAKGVVEGADSAAHYADYLTGGEVSEESAIAPGSGAVVRKGLHKVAVYRDESGAFHRCSAVCPHMGGIVHWNAMEKSWDCPVHGSRFAAQDGRCITSPAMNGLKSAE